ncbi:hypothetical protein INH39_16600 [Massilia violaceinigra]|uniref:Polyketide cyclase n=1 Tax=Massilia violaceinigra TaxID=2045208 RepID=A0ABY4AKI1_9BURK|nr:hypothetical protein [Massilia violaceinigra]UOD33113.1 hypothetical protein INH39_16600 [Massilia violaceinigra]
MDFDRAAVIAAAEYLVRHPAETLPSWFNECVTMSGTKTGDNKWNIMYSVHSIFELGPNQHWEEISGRRVLVEVDQKTMKSKFFISWHGPDPIEFFKISISKTDESAQVLLDGDISHMDVTKLERLAAK